MAGSGLTACLNPPRRTERNARARPWFRWSWVLSCGLVGSLWNARAQPPPAEIENPHGFADRCNACHESVDGRVQPIELDASDEHCLRCHNGRDAVAERHPIGMVFSGPHVEKPTDWPVVRGLLGCITCHDVKRDCLVPGGSSVRPPFLLRDVRTGLSDFCARCHRPEFYERFDPHRLVSTRPAPHDPTCTVCHVDGFHPELGGIRTGQPGLRADGILICVGCHRTHVDFFTPGHVGALLTPDIQWLLDRTVDGRRSTEGVHRVRDLLPVRDGVIDCATCHNPHPVGLFPEGSQLGLGATERDGPRSTTSSLRLPGGMLCQSCHGL